MLLGLCALLKLLSSGAAAGVRLKGTHARDFPSFFLPRHWKAAIRDLGCPLFPCPGRRSRKRCRHADGHSMVPATCFLKCMQIQCPWHRPINLVCSMRSHLRCVFAVCGLTLFHAHQIISRSGFRSVKGKISFEPAPCSSSPPPFALTPFPPRSKDDDDLSCWRQIIPASALDNKHPSVSLEPEL